MGMEYTAKCNKCGHEFEVSEGGGFFFHLLHCDKCGKQKSISFDEIGEPHLQYLKGLGGPYCVASSEHDKYVRDNYPGDPISEEEYYKIIEVMLGQCKCGGSYKIKAGPRCPKCGSDDYDDAGGIVCRYD